MARKTEGVYELVKAVLKDFSEPYSEDIILLVCQAIKKNDRFNQQYKELVDELGKRTVNTSIGRYTKEITCLKSSKSVSAGKGEIIKSYTKLIP